MSDIIQIGNEITKKINEIDEIRKAIRERGEQKAQTITDYEKQMAITLIRLKNGESFTLGSELICNPPASIMEKIAKGICYNEKLNMEKYEALYKSSMINLQAVMAQLNALQSIFRHLENT